VGIFDGWRKAMRLSLYLNDTAELINDPSYSFVSQFQMTRWVNEARRMLAMQTGCIRRLITGQSAFGAMSQAGQTIPSAGQPNAVPQAFNFGLGGIPAAGISSYTPGAVQGPMMTIPGVERYPYVGFFSPYLRQQHAGCRVVNDAISLAVSWGGVSKPTLDWMPWDEFQAYCRAYALLNQSYPSVWSVFNDGSMGEIWIFPVPSQANEMELDCFCLPSDLNSENDFDAIPESFSDNIKFGAASLCYLMTKRPAMADVMAQRSGIYALIQRAGADRGKSRTMYPVGP
jgi:hypothetical protein